MEPEDRYLQGVPAYKRSEMEEWRDVVGYESYFKVSNFGRIFSKRSNRILKLHRHKSGYMIFSTRLNGREDKALCFKVHRLVAEAFVENIENKPIINHIDSDRANNCVENLEWCTYKENANHCVKMGRYQYKYGIKSPSAKLTEQDVLFIREHYVPRHRELGARALGRKFGVNKDTIIAIIKRETWFNI